MSSHALLLIMSDNISVSLLLKELKEVVDWEVLGLHLNVPAHELKKIRKQFFHEGVERCKAGMFELWLEQEPADWRTMTDALEKLDDLNELARNLRQTYIGDTENQFTDIPQAIPISTPLTKPVIKVERNVVRILADLESKLARLVTDIKSCIQSREFLLSNLHYYIKIRLDLAQFSVPNTFEDLFDSIRPYYDILNICLLEDISNEYLATDANIQASLDRYKDELDSFRNNTKMEELVNNMTSLMHKESRKGTTAVVVLKLEGCWLNVTVKNFQKLVREIFSRRERNLCHIMVEKGCMCIRWLVPTSMVPYIVSMTKQRVELICNIGVIKLEIGNEIIFDKVADKPDINSFSLHLFNAVCQHNLDVIRLLLSIDISPNITDDDGKTPLIQLCECTDYHRLSLDVAEILIEAEANVDHSDSSGHTALVQAVHNQKKDIIKLLIANNASPNIHPVNYSCLRLAIELNDLELVEMLLAAGADPNVQNIDDGYTPLMVACDKGYIPIIKALKSSNVNLNAHGKDRWTGLMIACAKNHIDVVELLIISGADVNSIENSGWTSLMIACKKNYVEVVNCLIQAGADPNISTNDDWAAIHFASDPAIFLSLLEAGADPSKATKSGITPLHIACRFNLEMIVEILLSLNVPLNTKTSHDETPLMSAIFSNNINTVETMISAGAEVNPDSLAVSLQIDNPEITQLLLLHMDLDDTSMVNLAAGSTIKPRPAIDEELNAPTPVAMIRDAIKHPMEPKPTIKHTPQKQDDKTIQPQQ